MSYSRRQLYAMGEPLGDGATRREVGGKIIYGGGGGGTPEKQTTVVDIPDWAKPYAKESLGKAAALTNTGYQTYGGERIAQFTPLQKSAFDRAGGQQVAGQVGLGSGLAGLAGISSFQDQGTAQGFMSPYMQQVVDQQIASAQRQADIAATQRGAQAVRAGAFGGSRQAIENAEANRALASQKGDIQAKGLQSAFEQAQAQFNAEQGQRLTAAQSLGQLGQQQFGQEMDITGRQADLGAQQRAATQDILSQQYQDFLNQQRAPYDDLAFMSSIIRGTPMGQTTTKYGAAPSTTSQLVGLGTAAAGAYGAYAGGKGAAAGGSVHSYAAGGDIGIGALLDNVGSLSDAQLGQMQQGEQRPLTAAVVAEELLNREKMREDMAQQQQQAMMAPPPQKTVAEEALEGPPGLPGLQASNLDGMDTATMAGGGIIAFQGGGTAYNPYEYGYTPLSAERQAEISQRAVAPTFTSTNVSIVDRARFKQMNGLPLTAEEAAALKAPAAAAAPTTAAAPASNAPRVDLRKGMDDPRVGLEGLTPAKAKAEQAAAAKAQPAVQKTTPTGDGAGAGTAGLGSLVNMKDIYGKSRKDLEALGAEEKALAEQDLEAVRKDQEELGVRGADKKKRLDERAADIQKQKDLNPFMAMIDFGLATAAGESSNPFTNIAKGGMSGMKAYQEGLGRINRAQSDLDDKLSDLEDLQFSDAKANKTELRNAKNAVKKSEISTKKALAELGFKETDKLLDVWMETRKMQNQRDVASISASRSEKPFNYQDAYADYLKANAGKTDPVGRPLPVLSYADYIRQFALPQMAGASTTNALPQGAAVLPRR